MDLDIKFLFAVLASIIYLVSYIPYFKDMFSGKTKPHAYTWLIWAITQGTATVAVWYGGGKFGSVSLIVSTLMVLILFLFSLRYGSKNITKIDTIVLIAALLSIVVWWQLEQPLLAVFMVSAIDVLGYFPTYRKSFQEPWTETLLAWIGFIIGNYLAMLALAEYNLLTMTYLLAINFANITLVIICLMRRRFIPQNNINT